MGTNSGKIKARKYNLERNTWSRDWLVFDDSLYDDRNVAGGLNASGDKIILHFAQYDARTGLFKNIRTLISDDLTGAEGTWALQSKPVYINSDPKAAFSPHGHIVKLKNGDLLQGWFIREGTDSKKYGPFKMWLMRSIDNGVSWDAEYSLIYSGNEFYLGEPFIENLGDGHLICLARNNNKDEGVFKVGLIKSFDYGLTWQDYKFTNISGSGHILPYTYYDSENELLICTVLDRGRREFNLYTASFKDILDNPVNCWNYEIEIDSGFYFNGYASTVKFKSGIYNTVYAREYSKTDCDTKSFLLNRIEEESILLSFIQDSNLEVDYRKINEVLKIKLPSEDDNVVVLIKNADGKCIMSYNFEKAKGLKIKLDWLKRGESYPKNSST